MVYQINSLQQNAILKKKKNVTGKTLLYVIDTFCIPYS